MVVKISKTHDVGVFGNSRFLPVGDDLVEGRDETFFNFAIGGENFRNSIAMVERLRAVDKLPEVLIVQMDSFATPGDDNPESDGFLRRMRAAWRDLVAKGVTFVSEPRQATDKDWVATFTDPDGHFLTLFGPPGE